MTQPSQDLPRVSAALHSLSFVESFALHTMPCPAFAPPVGVTSALTCSNTSVSLRHAPLARAPIRRITKSTVVAQYNYNIYQDNEDRQRRGVGTGERVVTLQKPMGILLEEGQDGMVFIAGIDPSGTAAEEEDVNEGDIVVAVSATFGDDVWSTRGVGLDRVMKSIRVRAGDFVTLVLESPSELAGRKSASAAQAAQKRNVARETRGEREVINPVTWGLQKDATYEDGDPRQAEIDERLKQKLKNEIAAPYEQGWILYISGGIAVLALLLFISGISG